MLAGRCAGEVGEHRLERLEVAVDVRDDGVQHQNSAGRRVRATRSSTPFTKRPDSSRAVALGDLDRLVEHHARRGAGPREQLGDRDAQHGAVGGGEPLQRPVLGGLAQQRVDLRRRGPSSTRTTSSTSSRWSALSALARRAARATRRRTARPSRRPGRRRGTPPRARGGGRCRSPAVMPRLRARAQRAPSAPPPAPRRRRGCRARRRCAPRPASAFVRREHAVQHRHAGVERDAHAVPAARPRPPDGSARSRRGSRTPNASTASKRPESRRPAARRAAARTSPAPRSPRGPSRRRRGARSTSSARVHQPAHVGLVEARRHQAKRWPARVGLRAASRARHHVSPSLRSSRWPSLSRLVAR